MPTVRKFAWIPLRASRLHREPEAADPIAKAFRNGWTSDGWLFWEPYDKVTNYIGEVYRKRVRESDA